VAFNPSVPNLLQERGLFIFAEGARQAIDGCFGDLPPNPSWGGDYVARLHELNYLAAAEHALTAVVLSPYPVLPVTEPFAVRADDATLALMKTNCQWVEYHLQELAQSQSLRLSDITTFAGDVSKLMQVGIDFEDPPHEIGDIARAVDEIEHAHRQAPYRRARELGQSGVIRLQGFLWAVKLALRATDDLRQPIGDAYEAFELAKPVGGGRLRVPART
jgi:hypothetical protein